MTYIRHLAAFGVLIATFSTPSFAMGDKPEAKPQKRIIESANLCDAEEQTDVPLYY